MVEYIEIKTRELRQSDKWQNMQPLDPKLGDKVRTSTLLDDKVLTSSLQPLAFKGGYFTIKKANKISLIIKKLINQNLKQIQLLSFLFSSLSWNKDRLVLLAKYSSILVTSPSCSQILLVFPLCLQNGAQMVLFPSRPKQHI